MKKTRRNLILAASAGLALSATAQAQFQIGTGTGTFTDISATGAVITSGDDSSVAFTSGVTNSLVTSANLFACTNGRVTDTADGAFTNAMLPQATHALELCPLWDDLYVDAPGSLKHQMVNEGGVDVEVIQWDQVRLFGGTARGTFEIKIFASGPVLVQFIYADPTFAGGGGSATIGVQWSTTAAAQYSYNTAGSVSAGTVLSVSEISTTTGACCRTDGTCAEITQFSCGAVAGVYNGDNTTCATTTCAPAGACCIPSTLTCAQLTNAACTTAGGTWAGAGVDCAAANCPTPGACCLPDGTCMQSLPAACTAAAGTYRGDSTQCALQNCPVTAYSEGANDAGDTPATAAVLPSTGGPLTVISGATGSSGDADMYLIQICDPANFSASTIGGNGSLSDTQLFLFNTAGVGITADDDDPLLTGGVRSRLSSANVASLPAGNFYLAISGYNVDPQDASAQLLWQNTPFNTERVPDGPGAANPIASWTGTESLGTYNIFLTGCCFPAAPASCYANCDASTQQPCLNVLDFSCFLNQFAAGSSYANCDNSTQPPVLNVLDFSCFLNRFAAGCSSC